MDDFRAVFDIAPIIQTGQGLRPVDPARRARPPWTHPQEAGA